MWVSNSGDPTVNRNIMVENNSQGKTQMAINLAQERISVSTVSREILNQVSNQVRGKGKFVPLLN
jgi:hypothetical protein